MPHNGKLTWRRQYIRLSLEERFWPKVDKNGPIVRPELGPCWIWTGSILPGPGYGCIRDNGKTILAHRASWVLAGRKLPADGRYVCHKCDVRPCVNPNHLFDGSPKDNTQDARAKGRLMVHTEGMPRGSTHHQAKLTEIQIVEIRHRAAAGETLRSIAVAFGVSDTLIGYIVKRKFWRHVA